MSAELPETFLGISELPVELEGWQFSRDHTSLIFVCAFPYSPKEQVRFEDLFLTAARNLKKHGGAVDENSGNIIMIGLPAIAFGDHQLRFDPIAVRRWLDEGGRELIETKPDEPQTDDATGLRAVKRRV